MEWKRPCSSADLPVRPPACRSAGSSSASSWLTAAGRLKNNLSSELSSPPASWWRTDRRLLSSSTSRNLRLLKGDCNFSYPAHLSVNTQNLSPNRISVLQLLLKSKTWVLLPPLADFVSQNNHIKLWHSRSLKASVLYIHPTFSWQCCDNPRDHSFYLQDCKSQSWKLLLCCRSGCRLRREQSKSRRWSYLSRNTWIDSFLQWKTVKIKECLSASLSAQSLDLFLQPLKKVRGGRRSWGRLLKPQNNTFILFN